MGKPKRRHVTSTKMRAALARLRAGERENTYASTETFDEYTISGRAVRELERTEGRELTENPKLSKRTCSRWRGHGARGLQALEAVFYITGGYEAGGVWVA